MAERCTKAFENTLKITDQKYQSLAWIYEDWKTETSQKASYEQWKKVLLSQYRNHLKRVPANCCPIPRRPQCKCELVSTGKEGFLAQLKTLDKTMKVCDPDEPEDANPKVRELAKGLTSCDGTEVEANWQAIFEARMGNGWCESFAEAGRCLPRLAPPVEKNESCDNSRAAQAGYESSISGLGSVLSLANFNQTGPAREPKTKSSMPTMTGRSRDEPPALLPKMDQSELTHLDAAPAARERESAHEGHRAEASVEKDGSGHPVACGGTEASGTATFSSNRYYEVYVAEAGDTWELAGKNTAGAKCQGVILSNDTGSWVVRGQMLGSVTGPDGNRLYSEVMGALVLPKGAKRGSAPQKVEGGNLYWILSLPDGTSTYLKKSCSAQKKVIDAASGGTPLSTTIFIKPSPKSKEYEMLALDYHFKGPSRGEFTVGYPNVAMDRMPEFAVAGGMEPAAYAKAEAL